MKNKVKYVLQKAMGFNTYLYVFALFKIRTLKSDKNEKDFFHFLQFINDNKGLILDIGANIGIMSYHLAKRFPNTVIHSFEPIPQNVSILRKIKEKFKLKNMLIHPIALGEKSEKVKMILPKKDSVLFQGLSHVKHESIKEHNEGIEYEVQMESLDHFFNGEQIQAIKIDVENFEYFVLKGGERILNQNRPVIYAELWENENRNHCFDLLKQFSYNAFVVVNDETVPFIPTKHKTQNFIFIAN
jgi:FkbM family methyltransferase